MKEILLVLFKTTGVKIDQRWAYRILSNERKKIDLQQDAKPANKVRINGSSAPAHESAVPTARKNRGEAELASTVKKNEMSEFNQVAVAHDSGQTGLDFVAKISEERNPAMQALLEMLPLRPLDGAVDIDHPVPANLPASVNIELLRRVTKMAGFNKSWHTNTKLNLIRILPHALPEHINPVVQIGGLQCDLRLDMPEKFGKSSDVLGAKRGDDLMKQIINNGKLREQWRLARMEAIREYDLWLKEQIGLSTS